MCLQFPPVSTLTSFWSAVMMVLKEKKKSLFSVLSSSLILLKCTLSENGSGTSHQEPFKVDTAIIEPVLNHLSWFLLSPFFIHLLLCQGEPLWFKSKSRKSQSLLLTTYFGVWICKILVSSDMRWKRAMQYRSREGSIACQERIGLLPLFSYLALMASWQNCCCGQFLGFNELP